MDSRGVSPVIATLLLIAIAVAAGILTYIWTMGLISGITGTGTGQQVAEQLSMDVYDWKPTTDNLNITLRNPGSSDINISSVYFDGTLYTLDNDTRLYERTFGLDTYNVSLDAWPEDGKWNATTTTISAHGGLEIEINASFTPKSGEAYPVKIVTSSGASFTFDPVAGRVTTEIYTKDEEKIY